MVLGGETVLAFEQKDDVPSLAVLPFVSPNDPYYGVYISDRLVSELIFYRDVPVLQRRRFHLVEPDTLTMSDLRDLWRMPYKINQTELERLRGVAKSDWVIMGHVFEGKIGTRTVKIRMVDLADGLVKWEASMRDDRRWVWVYVTRKSGDIALEYMLGQMGFDLWDKSLPTFLPTEQPKSVSMMPLFSDQRLLTGIYERGIQEQLESGLLFAFRKSSLKDASRLGSELRQNLHKTLGVDAVLCGSAIVPGKEGTYDDQVAVAIRLVDLVSGHILWAGSSSVRHVWRQDRIDELIQADAAELMNDLAKVQTNIVAQELVLDEPKDGVEWIDRGMVYLLRGLLEQAEDAFEEAQNFSNAQTLALNGLGLVYARRPNLRSRAIDYFQRAVQTDSAYVEAYYNMAETYMKIGTGQVVDVAKKALQLDPEYISAYHLLGDWFSRGDWYSNPNDDTQAIFYFSAYLERVPDDVEVVEKLATVLLRVKDYEKLTIYLAPLANKKLDLVAILPFAAQLAYQQEKYDVAYKLWQQYLSQLSAQDRDLYSDLRFLLDSKDKAIYEALFGEQKERFMETYWQKHDPDLTTVVNERQLEHFRRVWFAQKNFSLSHVAWDRRGEVYVRYGEPDYRSRSNNVQAVTDLDVQRVKEQMFMAIYSQGLPSSELGGAVYPVRSLRGMQMRAVSDGARISAYKGEGRSIVHSFDDRSLVPWESWVYAHIGGGFEVTFTDEMGTGHFDFAPIPTDFIPGVRSLASLQSYAPENVFERVVAETPNLYSYWEEKAPLNFYYDMVDFRGDGDKSRLDVFYALRTDEIAKENNDVELKLSLALVDSTYEQVLKQDVQTILSGNRRNLTGALMMDGLTLAVAPGRYHMQVKAQDVTGGRVGVFEQVVDVDPYHLEGLKISDILLASDIVEDVRAHRFRRGDLVVIPLPTHAYLSYQELKLYFEVYNLSKNELGQTQYKVTVQVIGEKEEKVLQVKKNARPEVALTYEQVGVDDVAPIHLAVNLKNVKVGRNRLLIKVEDLNTQEVVGKETVFIYGD